MIVVVKLITSEEIIGKIENDLEYIYFDKTLEIEKPVKIIFIPENSRIAFLPFTMFSDSEKFILNGKNILSVFEANTEIKNAYNSKFGTNLIVPEKKGLIIP